MVSSWPDFAEENKIRDNIFEEHSRGGIRVEDDETEITGNLFIGEFDYIFVGAPFRARLDNHPVLDTLIRDNSYYAPGNTSALLLALIPDEHSGTILEDNLRLPNELGEFLHHGITKLPVPQRLHPRSAWKAAFDVDGTLVPGQCPDPDDEIDIDESSEGDSSSDATGSIDGTETDDTSAQDAGSEQTTPQLPMKRTSQVALRIADDADSGGADAIAITEDGQNTLSQELLVVRRTTRTARDPSHLSLPFSS